MFDINREHPEHVAERRARRQNRDLYVGGEPFKARACDYLVRRQKEPADVYGERLVRVFYENYAGSIIDWYTATLFRREPVLQFAATEHAAKAFYNLFAEDCDLKGT